MRMNLFASSLLTATSTALYINNQDLVSALAPQSDNSMMMSYSLAQTQTTGWNLDGTRPSMYLRPDDDCCIVYLGDDFTEPHDKPVCSRKKEGRDQYTQTHFLGADGSKNVKGLDCGKNTWAQPLDIQRNAGLVKSMGIAGRMTYNFGDEYARFGNVRVGTYDDKVMPAVMLFQTADCKGEVSYHMYDRSASGAGAFSLDDIHDQRKISSIKSIMLRSGYSVTLYADNGWSGASEKIQGAYADDGGEGKLKCQKITNTTILKKDVASFRIQQDKAGRATGFWKGITSTEAQKFTYTVGITSTDSASSAQSNADKLSESLKSGWNAGVSAEATVEAQAKLEGVDAGASAKAGAGAEAGLNSEKTKGKAQQMTVSREISSTASHGTTSTHETTCTPKEGESRAGIWQWVITSEDISVSAFTPHTVCRTGDLAFVSPTCSFWDCDNADCSKCKEQPITVKDSTTREQAIDETEDSEDE